MGIYSEGDDCQDQKTDSGESLTLDRDYWAGLELMEKALEDSETARQALDYMDNDQSPSD